MLFLRSVSSDYSEQTERLWNTHYHTHPFTSYSKLRNRKGQYRYRATWLFLYIESRKCNRFQSCNHELTTRKPVFNPKTSLTGDNYSRTSSNNSTITTTNTKQGPIWQATVPQSIVRIFILILHSCYRFQAESGWTQFHPDSAWKRSSKTWMKVTSAECTVENFWWWAEKMPETCRVL